MTWAAAVAGAGLLVVAVWSVLKLSDRLGDIYIGSPKARWNSWVAGPSPEYRRAFRTYFTVERIVFELTILLMALSLVVFMACLALSVDPTPWVVTWLLGVFLFHLDGARLIWSRLSADQRGGLHLKPSEGAVPPGAPRTYAELIHVLRGTRSGRASSGGAAQQ